MKYRVIITVLIVTAMMAACSKSDTPRPSVSDDYTPSTTPISFQTKYNWGDEDQTKAAELKGPFVKDDNIGVIGYYLPSDGASVPTELSDDAAPNFMYNQKMICDGRDWNYSPLKYWPNNINDRFQFFAYYPQRDGVTLSSNDAKGYPEISFKPAVNPHKQVDFMTATSAVVGKEDQGVTLNFKHQLSQVSFKATHNGDPEKGDYRVSMTGITLTGAKIYKGQFTADGFQWDTKNAIKSDIYEATDDNNEINVAELEFGSYTTVTNEDGIMLLIPQELSENDIKIYATFKARLPGQHNMIEVTQEIVVAKKHEYRKGEKLNYLFTLDVVDLAVAKFDDITITDWVNSGEVYEEKYEIL